MSTSYLPVWLIAALLGAGAAAAAPWSAVPLAQWTEAPSAEGWAGTIDERYFGWKGPETHEELWAEYNAPTGYWQEQGEGLSVVGRQARWSTRLHPGDAGANQRITTQFTVERSSRAPLQLPHMQPPTRWSFHWGENLSGWDFGVVLRYQDALNFYRVMVSADRGQLALWDANGGFLQIVPCPVRLGQAHRLEITARGAHLQAALDGQPVLDYWDRTLPNLRGQVGLSAWKSRVQVAQFAVTPVAAETAPPPPHQPRFRLDREQLVRYQLVTSVDEAGDFHYQTGLGMVLYDGYEPISVFVTNPPEGTFYQGAVKLKPGWRPAYYSQVGPALNYKWPTLAGELPGAVQVEEEGETLRCRFRMNGLGGSVGDQELTVRYDAERGVYRYEYRVTQQFAGEQPLEIHNWQPTDPLTYNNRGPGPEVQHRWNYAGHRWWVYEAQEGGWHRMPMVDYLAQHNNPDVLWGRAADFLYPDPAAAPSFEVDYQWPRGDNWRAGIGMCTWGYDYHHWAMANPSAKLAPGTALSYTVTYSALLPAEAEARFAASALRTGVESDARPLLVFDPRGGPLQVSTWQDPASTMIWEGAAEVDPQGGRRGGPALHVDGPGEASVLLYQHMIEQYARRWWVRGWYKTERVRGRGLQLQVKYAYQPEPADNFYLGGVGDRDWTWFSYITTAPARRDCSSLSFSLDGPGQVWLEGVAISALAEGETPRTTSFTLPAGLEPSREVLIDLAMAEAPGKAVYDESRNGHALYLRGADPGVAGPQWRQEGGRGYLHFTGQEAAQLFFQAALERRDAPPEITPQVLADWGVPYEGYKPIFPLREFTYEWWLRPEKTVENPGRMILFQSRFNPVVALERLADQPDRVRLSYQNHIFCGEKLVLECPLAYDQWSHVAITHGQGRVVVYVNGEPAAEATYDPQGPGFWSNVPRLDFGRAMAGLNKAGSGFRGDLGPFRLYARALSPEEIRGRAAGD